jgi:hypothetical protein
MSRRGRHGRHSNPGIARPGAVAPERPAGAVETRPDVVEDASEGVRPFAAAPADAPATPVVEPAPVLAPVARSAAVPVDQRVPDDQRGESGPGRDPVDREPQDDQRPSCTTAQLRRFIKSRPWVPMHELRRRFGIWGVDDDVSPMRVGDRTLFIGLPPSEARMMAELLSGGDVGYELSLDPDAPIVVGVYPMRPVPRS